MKLFIPFDQREGTWTVGDLFLDGEERQDSCDLAKIAARDVVVAYINASAEA